MRNVVYSSFPVNEIYAIVIPRLLHVAVSDIGEIYHKQKKKRKKNEERNL